MLSETFSNSIFCNIPTKYYFISPDESAICSRIGKKHVCLEILCFSKLFVSEVMISQYYAICMHSSLIS